MYDILKTNFTVDAISGLFCGAVPFSLCLAVEFYQIGIENKLVSRS